MQNDFRAFIEENNARHREKVLELRRENDARQGALLDNQAMATAGLLGHIGCPADRWPERARRFAPH